MSNTRFKAAIIGGAAALMLATTGGAWANEFRVLYRFQSGTDASSPRAGLVAGSNGELYGTAFDGGDHGRGAVFKLLPHDREAVLYSFTADQGQPLSGLIADAKRNLYGVIKGDATSSSPLYGLVFKLSRRGQETILYRFTGGSDGLGPIGPLVIDGKGNFYGVTQQGGAGNGTVFKLSPGGRETVLFNFISVANGGTPGAGLIMGANGNLYGTTGLGGAFNQGVVFKLSPSGKETVLYSFNGPKDAINPLGRLVMDADGNLYGTATEGGKRHGVVFKVWRSGREKVLHAFTGGDDGANPVSGLIMDTDGNLYGTTFNGGVSGDGVVFKLSPAGTETVLHSFAGGTDDGAHPFGDLIMDMDGNLYGTTSAGGHGLGTVFRVKNRAQPANP